MIGCDPCPCGCHSAKRATEKPIAVSKVHHLAWVIVHNVLEPQKGFGGCSCDICSLLRGCMKAIREKEAREYIEAMHKGADQ